MKLEATCSGVFVMRTLISLCKDWKSLFPQPPKLKEFNTALYGYYCRATVDSGRGCWFEGFVIHVQCFG